MPVSRPPMERLSRLAASCWPARDCWPDNPRTGRVKKRDGQRRARHETLRDRRTGLARQLEQAQRSYEIMLDEKVKTQACNDAIVAAAGKLDVLPSRTGTLDVRCGLEERARVWERYEAAWQDLTMMHCSVVSGLEMFESGPERLLLSKSSLEAIRQFFDAMGAFAVAQHGPASTNIISIGSFAHLISCPLIRTTDVDGRRRYCDDGMTVQERYTAAQEAIARAFPREVAPLSDAAKEELKRMEEEVDGKVRRMNKAYGPYIRHHRRGRYGEEYTRLMTSGEARDADEVGQLYLQESRRLHNALAPTEEAYVEARDRFMRAGGAPYDDEDSTHELRNVDIDLPTFSEHPADWTVCQRRNMMQRAPELSRKDTGFMTHGLSYLGVRA
ncbi:hypothetical protein LTR86_004368 [Recurvomyces mirabilis]|nr:hypothetical protein LTR86_004368 [Recurvomyces mirabilis]